MRNGNEDRRSRCDCIYFVPCSSLDHFRRPSFCPVSSRLQRLIVFWGGRSLKIALVLKILDDDLDGVLNAGLVALNMNFRLQGLLIRRTDTSELGDLALSGFLVQTLGVTLFSDLDGDIDPDLNEGDTRLAAGSLGFVKCTSLIAVGAIGRDEGCDGDGARVSEELGDLGDSANVLLTILGAEAQVLVQTEADIVAVQTVGSEVVGVAEKCLLKCDGDGGLAGG
jgi:hypothetical protein